MQISSQYTTFPYTAANAAHSLILFIFHVKNPLIYFRNPITKPSFQNYNHEVLYESILFAHCRTRGFAKRKHSSKKTSRNTFVLGCFYQIKLQLIIIQCRFHLQFISCCTRNIILCIDFKHFRFSCTHVHNNTVSCSF